MSHCGEKFRRRYMEGHVIPPGVFAAVGSGTDGAVTADLNSKIKTATLLPDSDIKDIARDGVIQTWKRGIVLDEQELQRGERIVKAEAVDKAVRLASLHHHDLAPVIEPTAVQEAFSLNLDSYLKSRGVDWQVDVVGSMDIREEYSESRIQGADEITITHDNIRDTKTSGKTPQENVAHESDQLTGYALGYAFTKAQKQGRGILPADLPSGLTLDYLIDTKVPKSKVFTTVRTLEDVDIFLNRVTMVAHAIKSGVFMPTKQDDPMCSPKYCGYFHTCAYVKRPRTVASTGLVTITTRGDEHGETA